MSTSQSAESSGTPHIEDAPLRAVVVGAGAMGLEWVRILASDPGARIVGLVDLDVELAMRVAREEGLDIVVGDDLEEVAANCQPEVAINVTVPVAHRAVNEKALRLGLPVLCEKPLAPTLPDALQQVALADVTGQLLMVSQSRRYFGPLRALRDAVSGLGPLGIARQEFYHEDHEPGFREQMQHPLLIDMSIHHFDAFRFATGDEAVSVRCSAWNPPWSWFQGDASAIATFDLASGARFVYSGSRCAPGPQSSWNADWRLHFALGTVTWDGERELRIDDRKTPAGLSSGPEELAGSLDDFVRSVRTGVPPQTEVRANIRSLAMVEAAVVSSRSGGAPVVIADLLAEAYRSAVHDEECQDVLTELRGWTSVSAIVDAAPPRHTSVSLEKETNR